MMPNRFIGFAAALLVTSLSAFGSSQSAHKLEFSASIEASSITEPNAAHLILHFHNAGTKTVWLYQPVRDIEAIEGSGDHATDGSWLSVRLSRAGAGGSELPGRALTLATRTMPHPKIIRLAPNQDAEEHVLISMSPAFTDKQGKRADIWGSYSLTMTYGAHFSNASDLVGDPGIDLWEGNVSCAPLAVTLNPPAGAGKISGDVFDRASAPIFGALVSLSDSRLALIAQLKTNADARFAFHHVSPGEYWVTVRQPGADDSTDVVRHFVVSADHPDPFGRLMLLHETKYKANQMEHKPVVLRVDDRQGRPIAGAVLRMLAAPEPIVETLKAKTDAKGRALVFLLPGSVFITAEKHGCRKRDHRIDVGEPPGVDGFTITMNCNRR